MRIYSESPKFPNRVYAHTPTNAVHIGSTVRARCLLPAPPLAHMISRT
jgi:hypothetical protein